MLLVLCSGASSRCRSTASKWRRQLSIHICHLRLSSAANQLHVAAAVDQRDRNTDWHCIVMQTFTTRSGQHKWNKHETDLPQLAADATRSSLESLCTTADLVGTGTGLVALAAAVADGHGDVLCDDVPRSTHGEQRFSDDTFSVAMLDCILSDTCTLSIICYRTQCSMEC